MHDVPEMLPGLEAVRAKFLAKLRERQAAVHRHAMNLQAAGSGAAAHADLLAAQDVLHQVAGTAELLGYGALGQCAQDCDTHLTELVEGPGAQASGIPQDLIGQMQRFVALCRDVLGAPDRDTLHTEECRQEP
jgi:hypothetical protein